MSMALGLKQLGTMIALTRRYYHRRMQFLLTIYAAGLLLVSAAAFVAFLVPFGVWAGAALCVLQLVLAYLLAFPPIKEYAAVCDAHRRVSMLLGQWHVWSAKMVTEEEADKCYQVGKAEIYDVQLRAPLTHHALVVSCLNQTLIASGAGASELRGLTTVQRSLQHLLRFDSLSIAGTTPKP